MVDTSVMVGMGTLDRIRDRARGATLFVAGMAASAALIAGSLTSLNVHVLGFTDWPLTGGSSPRAQVLPDPVSAEPVARISDGVVGSVPVTLSLPGAGDAAAAVVTSADVASSAGTVASGASAAIVEHRAASDGQADDVGSQGDGHGAAGVDSDGDGLSDATERILGTDPQRSDSDGDGIPDAYEVNHRLNPRLLSDASADPDGDGLSNRNEYLVQADPRRADSNEDGIDDGADDSDGDGIPNAVEQRLGLNPSTRVSRGAGEDVAPPTGATTKPKGGESASIGRGDSTPLAPTAPGEGGAVSDGDLDADGDGFSNAAEVLAGSDPADATSRPAPVDPTPTPEDPTPVDPTPTPDEPVPTDPVPTDPVPTDPVPTDPVPVDPAPPADPAPASAPTAQALADDATTPPTAGTAPAAAAAADPAAPAADPAAPAADPAAPAADPAAPPDPAAPADPTAVAQP
jgi:Bacterial TSP3 repeat